MHIKKSIVKITFAVFTIVLILSVSGCATVTRIDTQTSVGLYRAILDKPVSQERVYNNKYDIVYEAIVRVLNQRLGYQVSRLHTPNNIIFSSYLDANISASSFIGVRWAYGYLFELEKIDEEHTRVTLRASGGILSNPVIMGLL
jgi:hypothetical protein